jgi:hypothetical protein
MDLRQSRIARTASGFCIPVSILVSILLSVTASLRAPAQEPDPATLIRSLDAAVTSRSENVLGFSDVEHYVVYRGGDETHPAAEMTVRDTYKKGVGKTYTVLSESGSSILLRFGLRPLLDNEQIINQPGNVERSWFNSANYVMTLKAGGMQKLNGYDCFVLDIKPKEEAPNLIVGTIWVDARDGTLVKVDGVASKNPSAWSGAAHMMRQYANIDGYSMAMHVRAESDSALFGRTVVTIDYSDYKLEVKNGKQ